MFHYNYTTSDTCSMQIIFDLDGENVHNVRFIGGCNGNLQGISRLVEGMTVTQIKNMLSGIRCGNKRTSCPDQLSCAVQEGYEKSLRAAEK